MRLPTSLFTTEDVRAMDHSAINDYGVDSYLLMSRAAQTSLRALRERFVTARALAVVCGAGNNAGDGYLLAKMAQDQGLRVAVFAVVDPGALTGDAARAWQDARAAGVPISAIAPDHDCSLYDAYDLIVDSLLGSGLTRPVEGLFATVVRQMNASGKPVVSLDLPSGLDGNTGMANGVAVEAELTVTFVALKVGLFTGDAKRHCGRIVFDDLQIPSEVTAQFTPIATRINAQLVQHSLQHREADAHKTRHGRVLIIGGGSGMPGAVILAGTAALRAGAGVVKVGCHPDNVSTVVSHRPELMCNAIENDAGLNALLDWCDVIAIGPGLGRDAWAQKVFDCIKVSRKPTVVDADALFFLSESGAMDSVTIVTPHAGEAATLLHATSDAVQNGRIRACRDIATRYQCVAVLKGAGTVVCNRAAELFLCDKGNPGMATAGTGDVLTGIVVALLAQGLREMARVAPARRQMGRQMQNDVALQAATIGVWVHAMAGDLAAESGQRGMIASDLLDHIRGFVN